MNRQDTDSAGQAQDEPGIELERLELGSEDDETSLGTVALFNAPELRSGIERRIND